MKASVLKVLAVLYTFNFHCANSEPIRHSEIKPRLLVFNDPSDVSVFYSLQSNDTIKKMSPRPWFAPGQSLKLPFIGDPCACNGYQCGCCAGIRISQFNFDRQICANVTYDSYQFGLVLDVTINNNSVLHNVLSAKNPPPICLPVPLGPIPGVTFCIKLYDIYTDSFNNLHVCMDWELRLASFPVLILHFDCINIGTSGVSVVKPGDEEIILAPPTTEHVDENDGTIYDEVTELKADYSGEYHNSYYDDKLISYDYKDK
ncbi:uncharacterized protein LOC143918945 [Arctopsyche grandis]|uniref:uncharacterized protein LOC143918945 n=1 Tax=Arctopsyche grandis TaxID=121162 RepID=UPI00406D8D0B